MDPETPTKCSILTSIATRLSGIGIILLSGVCISFYAASKHLLVEVPTGMFTTYSGIFCLLVSLPVIGFKDVSMFGFERKRLVFLKAIFASGAGVARTWSIKNMKFGEAMSIVWTAPFFSIFMAHVILGHKVNKVQMLCCVLSAVGVTLVSKPEFIFQSSAEALLDTTEYSPYGPLVAGLGALLTAAGMTTQKAICDSSIDPIIPVVYLQCFNLGSGVIYSIVTGESLELLACYETRVVLVVGGVLTLLGKYLFNIGMSLENPATAGLVKNFDLVFCYAIQVFFFMEPADYFSVSGTGCILLSVLLIAGSRFYYDAEKQKERGEYTKIPASKKQNNDMVKSENNGK